MTPACVPFDQIEPPDGWTELRIEQLAAGRIRAFAAPANGEARIIIHERGRQLAETAAAAMFQILNSPPHVISVQERDLLFPVIAEKVDNPGFCVTVLETLSLESNMFLSLRGQWLTEPTYCWSLYSFCDAVQRFFREVSLVGSESDTQAMAHQLLMIAQPAVT